MQVREKDKAYREARAAVRSAEKLLMDPPPTDKLVLYVSETAKILALQGPEPGTVVLPCLDLPTLNPFMPVWHPHPCVLLLLSAAFMDFSCHHTTSACGSREACQAQL